MQPQMHAQTHGNVVNVYTCTNARMQAHSVLKTSHCKADVMHIIQRGDTFSGVRLINPPIVIVVSVDEPSSLAVVMAGVDVSAIVRYKPNTSMSESEGQNDLFCPQPDYHSPNHS